jgi:aspartate-semialdehyde dehydrogenase
VSVRTRRPLPAAEARALLAAAPRVKVLDTPGESVYPMPMLAVNDEAVLVGRIRDDATQENGLALFVAGDNLCQGGAAAAIRVARLLAERHLAGHGQ